MFLQHPGGLKSNEEAKWALAPPKYSKWGTLCAASEAVFTTTVMRTEGADKQVLFDATVFTERDNSRLEELKKKTLIGACYLVCFGGLFLCPEEKWRLKHLPGEPSFRRAWKGSLLT
ncbi:hypothetical protein ACFEY4_000229 [Enterobacter asburiae]|jgi:hypothetical protein|nr:hypothetical protein [Enterobacter asburiae]